MKTIAVALVVLLAGVNALPYEVQHKSVKNQRNFEDIISGILDSISQQIIDRALDPFVVDYAEGDYDFPIDGVFSAKAYAKNFVFSGLSNIVVNDVSFSGSSLNIDIELPQLQASVEAAAFDMNVLSREIYGEASGRLAINGLRIAARVDLGFSGYFIDDLDLGFRLGGIESELYINIMGRDISNRVNNFLSNRLANTLIENEELLNRIIAEIIVWVMNNLP